MDWLSFASSAADPPPPLAPPGDATLRANSAADFEAIEAEIARRLACNPQHCAFLRSSGYLLFRICALYRARDTPASIYTPCGMRVDYAPDAGGGRVTLHTPPTPDQAPAGAEAGRIPQSILQSTYRVYMPLRGPGRPRKTA